MEYLSIFIIPVLGAVIGYSTNVLAIAMLFRPHREIRLLGFRIPFTPGLLVKERRKLARKIGETLSDNVITGEALEEALANSKIVENIVNLVDKLLTDLAATPKNLGEICADALGRKEDDIKQGAKAWVKNMLETLSRGHTFSIQSYILEYLRGENLRRAVVGHASNLISNIDEDKKMRQILPQGLLKAVKTAISANVHHVAPMARKFFADPATDDALRELVAKIVKQNAGGLMGMFVKPDKIYQSIQVGLLEYLDNRENQAEIAIKLHSFVDNFLERNVASFTKITDYEKWLDNIVLAMQSNLSDGQTDAIKDFFNRQVEKYGPQLLEKATDSIFALTPAKILPYETYRTSVIAIIRKMAVYAAQKASAHMTDALDIAAITEQRINAFDAKEAERLVLGVAGKQLGYIAMLGGLLGFIIGFLPAIISMR